MGRCLPSRILSEQPLSLPLTHMIPVQERATAVSHSATSRHARELGDPVLADICMAIANDERRHELAYTRIVDEMWNLCACRTHL